MLLLSNNISSNDRLAAAIAGPGGGRWKLLTFDKYDTARIYQSPCERFTG